MDKHIPAISIHCSPILDLDRIVDVINATSEEWKDGLVNCNDKTGLQKIFMVPSGTDPITRVIFQCVLFDVPDNEVAEVVGDNPVG